MPATLRRTLRAPISGRATLLLATALATLAGCGQARTSSGGPATPECERCHGGTYGNAAPPRSVTGETATSVLAVGAHQAHLKDSPFRKAIACQECHVVPASGTDHAGGGAATLTFGALATSGGATPAWDRPSATCNGVYCHGETLHLQGSNTRPIWTSAPGAITCSSCHASPPDSHGEGAVNCSLCHPSTVKPDGTIDLAGGHHIDGVQDVGTVGCVGCHDAPPATGAHMVHATPPTPADVVYGQQVLAEDVDPSGATGRYYFGCGACHPTDLAKHRNGALEVELSPTATGLRAKNAALAAYDGATCSGVYCHSSGQATPAFAATPAWVGGATTGCGDCHGNPPSYANGGPASGSANSHIFLNWYGYEGGHFAPLPGPFHLSRHGNPSAFTAPQSAAPVTCQACHAETVDPSNVAPGGVFYLDTSLTTRLPGGDPTRFQAPKWLDTQCASCHDGAAGSPPVGQGKVLPLRHVNGRRDVAFDGRTEPPVGYFGALGAAAPTELYFAADVRFPAPVNVPPAVGVSPAVWQSGTRGTLSLQLSSAAYAPATQSCSSVACHLGRAVAWGQKDFETPAPTCTGCHGMP